MSVVIETTLGDFTVDLFIKERPHACKNFLKLCKIKYYNLCLFHSVQHNFIAQTGDPTGTGKNGESIFGKIHGEERRFFEAEVMPKIKHTRSGLLSMVNCGDNMLGSQFFVTLASDLQSLDSEHCVFGELAEGHEILLKLNEVICDTEHRPYQDIRITHMVILEDPFEDPSGMQVPEGSPEPTKENMLNSRIAPDEDLDETKGLSAKELQEIVRDREAQAQATILEIVGDLPDADMAPPENVLFVCKLNPVTTDDDLEIIFSRFGKVKGCEVIRDKVTGDSLQYAFVEFEEQKSCEDAFFKMDNVLIDDRRIHVDFSQSVSKLRWKGKGRGVEHIDEDSSKRDNGRERSNNAKKQVGENSNDQQTSSKGRSYQASESRAIRNFRDDSNRSDNRRYEDASSYKKDNDKKLQNERLDNRQLQDNSFGRTRGRIDYKEEKYERSGDRGQNYDRRYSNREQEKERDRNDDYRHVRTYLNKGEESERFNERYQGNYRRGYASREAKMEHSGERKGNNYRSDREDKSYNYSNREEMSERHEERYQNYKRDSSKNHGSKTWDKKEEDGFNRKHTNSTNNIDEEKSSKRHFENSRETKSERSREDEKIKTRRTQYENEREFDSHLRFDTNQGIYDKGSDKKREKESKNKIRSSSSSDSSASSESSSSDSPDRGKKVKIVKKRWIENNSTKKTVKQKTHGKKKSKGRRKVSSSSNNSSSSSDEEIKIVKKKKCVST